MDSVGSMSAARYRSYAQTQRQLLRVREQEVVARVLSLPEKRIEQFRATFPGAIAATPTGAEDKLVKARARIAALEKELRECKSRYNQQNLKLQASIVKVQCCVCRENDKSCVLDCGHCFCEECVEMVSSCPLCSNGNMETFPVYL